MAEFEHALVLLLLIASLSVVGRWLPWPQLITYLLGGVGAALLPVFPRFKLDPGFFFLCFLPPLLFSDGWLMPLREFVRARRAILTLAIGLVLFTTVTVGLVPWWLVPCLPLAMAFALGAVVSPTDPVAGNAPGLYSGWRDPVRMDVETRQSTFAVWELLIFWLNGIAFVLLGLQFPPLLAAVRDHYSVAQLLGFTAIVSGTAIVARLAWIFSGIYLPSLSLGVCTNAARPASALVVGWAGMRGTVTPARALSLPLVLPAVAPFPGRAML